MKTGLDIDIDHEVKVGPDSFIVSVTYDQAQVVDFHVDDVPYLVGIIKLTKSTDETKLFYQYVEVDMSSITIQNVIDDWETENDPASFSNALSVMDFLNSLIHEQRKADQVAEIVPVPAYS